MTMSLLTSSQTRTLYTNSISASLTDKVTSRNVTIITHIPSLKPVSKTPYHTIKAKSSQNGNNSVVVTGEKVTIKSSNSKNDENCEDIKASLNDVKKFNDGKWMNGTWDLQQFKNNVNGTINWDAVIDAEAKRRKWLQTYPESTSNAEPIIFNTSIVPWWAWIKRFHLPEAELLNGRAAMVGFFMSYFVDSLTGVGLVNQMGNFVCKTLLFVSVLGVLFIRKNEDIENLKKLLEESTFYDKQWQATWQDKTKKN